MFALIVTAYNAQRTLADTLASLAHLEEKSRVELVLADDASTDGTYEALEAFKDRQGGAFGRCVLTRTPENRGAGANLHQGLTQVQSSYATFMGSDDLIEDPTFPRNLETALEAHPGLVLARTEVVAVDPSEGTRWRVFSRHGRFFELDARRQFALTAIFGSLFECGPGAVFHVPTVRAIPGAVDPSYRLGEDAILHLRTLLQGHPIRFLPVPGVVWLRTPAGISYRGNLHRLPLWHREIARRRREILEPNLGLLTPWERLLHVLTQGPWPLNRLPWWITGFGRELRRARLP